MMYANTQAAINAVIEVAKAEEGYLEKKSNSNLDSKTANAGYNNYTKYWRDLAKAGVMGQSSTFAGGPAWYWCAGFVTWDFMKAFGLDLAKQLLMHMPYISCANMGDIAKKNGRLMADPKAGDIVLFWNGSRFSHTGLVYKVTSTTFYTVEGNTNSSKSVVANGGGVCLKSYSIATYKSKGAKFVRPDYSLAVDKSLNKKPAEDTATVKVKSYVKVNTESGANLHCRKSNSKLSASLGKFANGTKLILKDDSRPKWWKVKGKDINGNTITGFCSAAKLKRV